MVLHRINKYSLVLYAYLALCLVFLYTIGIDAIEGKIDFEFYADSETYLDFVKYNDYSYLHIIREFFNMIGPTLVLNLLDSNFYLIFILNITIVLYFYNTITKIYTLDKSKLLLWLLISPIFFSSVIAINKEIFTLLVLAFMIKFEHTKKVNYFILALLSSIIVRWQMSLFVILNILFMSDNRYIKNYFKTISLSFLMIYSIVFFYLIDKFEGINSHVEIGSVINVKSGIFNTLNDFQKQFIFGYFIVFIPKFIFSMIGNAVKLDNLFEIREFYGRTIIPIQSIFNLCLLTLVIYGKKYHNTYIVRSAIIYGIIFSVSPIFSIRYLFPVYIYLVILYSIKSNLKLHV